MIYPMDQETTTMRTFKIVARDSSQVLEIYVIEANTIACAFKKIKKMWKDAGFKHSEHITFAWSEVPEGVKPEPLRVPAPPAPLNPAPVPAKPRVTTPPAASLQEDYVLPLPARKPTPAVNIGSGIFTDIEGKHIELALVPKEDY